MVLQARVLMSQSRGAPIGCIVDGPTGSALEGPDRSVWVGRPPAMGAGRSQIQILSPQTKPGSTDWVGGVLSGTEI